MRSRLESKISTTLAVFKFSVLGEFSENFSQFLTIAAGVLAAARCRESENCRAESFFLACESRTFWLSIRNVVPKTRIFGNIQHALQLSLSFACYLYMIHLMSNLSMVTF